MRYLTVGLEDVKCAYHARTPVFGSFKIEATSCKAVASDEVIDIFSAAGLKKPDFSILSDEFLSEVRDLPHKNLAIETLRNLLNDEIKACSKELGSISAVLRNA